MRRHLFDIKGARELGDGGTGNDIIKGSRATLTNLADELRPVMQDEGYAIILNNRELTHKSASYFHKIDPCCTFRLRSSTADSREHKRLGGIYLGELVWALINILIVKILMTKPTKLVLNSTLAAAFAVRDVAHYTVARTLELAMNVPRSLQDGRTNNVSACFLRVRLMSGRYLVKHGGKGAISTHCVVQLRSEDDRESNLIDQDTSKISLWSKSPRWKETFFLGPVSILKDTQLKVLCVHQERVPGKSGYWDTLSSSAVGELNVPLLAIGTTKVSLDTSKMFLNHRQKATPTRELVGWFQLGLPTAAANDLFPLEGAVSDGQSRQARCVENSYSHSSQAIHFAPHCRQVNVLTGQIKLGLRIISPERLRV